MDVTLEDILVFATGCDEIPITGFDRQPTLEFSTTNIFPTVSTCVPTLRIPLNLQGYEEFSANMRMAIFGSFGFGQVQVELTLFSTSLYITTGHWCNKY